MYEERAGSRAWRPVPPEFVTFVPYACGQLEASFEVRVNVECQGQYYGLDDKKKNKRTGLSQRHLGTHSTRRALVEPSGSGLAGARAPTAAGLGLAGARAPTAAGLGLAGARAPTAAGLELAGARAPAAAELEDGVVLVHAVMDSADNLVEIAFRRCVTIPRMLIQVIGWSVPHHDFLSRLTIRWATLDAIALYEFSKFLSNVNLTEICLDDSPVKGRNYEVLLASPNSLRYLSLARCDLDDEDTARLATHLQYPRPAASSLAVLLLVANRVGDAGAAALADALRSNRTLRCLNLSGNVISDVGAISIFETLTEFPLTADEIIKKRLRFLEYLKLKSEVYDKCVRQLILERNHDEGRAMRRRPTLQAPQRRYSVKASQFSNALYQKAEALANELVGVFTDPFSVEQTVTRSDHTYCIGNTSLCWLNLSYNNLEYSSLGALYEALAHQQWLGPRAAPGLLRVNVDGNRLPVDCDQLFLIEDLLHRARCSKSRQIKHVVDKLRPGRVRSSS